MTIERCNIVESLSAKISSIISSRFQEQLEFLVQVCNQNSYTYNKAGTDNVATMLLDKLNNILPVHKIFPQDDVGNHHLLQTRKSTSSIFLIGHMDTVFPLEHSFQQCQRNGDLLTGPGTGDMKGGLVVFIFALKALHEIGVLDRLPVTVLFNADEEIGSVTSKPIFFEQRKKALVCLSGECAGLHGEIVVSRNGKMGAKVESYGQDRHVAFGTHEKSSAILELAQKIIALEKLNACIPGVSLNVGKISGGLGPATVPKQAQCFLDIRWVEEKHNTILLEKIQKEINKNSQPGCNSEFTILNSRPAMPLQSATLDLFETLQTVGREIGQEVKQEHRRGTSDANFFGSVDIPALDGFGPICDKDHTENEYIKISSLKERTILLASFLLKLGKKFGNIV